MSFIVVGNKLSVSADLSFRDKYSLSSRFKSDILQNLEISYFVDVMYNNVKNENTTLQKKTRSIDNQTLLCLRWRR